MKKYALILISTAVLCAIAATAVFAESVSLSGSLTPGGATESQVAIITTPNCNGAYNIFTPLYKAYPFTVDTDGTYTFTEPGTVSAIYVYTGGFDPANPATNCLAASNINPINLPVSLTAGTSYILVIIDDTHAQNGLNYTLGISGPGNITVGSGKVTACTYPLPEGSVVYSVPAGAPTFFADRLDTQTNFDLPAGTWYISEFKGDFAKVWLSCEGQPFYIPANAVAH